MSAKLFLLSLLSLAYFWGQAQTADSILRVEDEPSFPRGNQVENTFPASKGYLKNRDLDGDGEADLIFFTYSGGAHCCYTMSIRLTSQSGLIEYPFQMDGGYMYEVDDSWPDKFRIEDVDGDGRMEIRMEINTYNGRPNPWPKRWTRRYGIHQNDIIFEFVNGEMMVRDDLDKPLLEE